MRGDSYQWHSAEGLANNRPVSHRHRVEGGISMSATIEKIGKGASMAEFFCKICGKKEGEPQGWRLVIELEKPGTTIRNTIFVLDQWDEKRASDPHAACFCSPDCESKYLAARHQQLVA
jgi:hypothetical protein